MEDSANMAFFSYFPHFFQDETISRNGSSRKKATGKDTMELETCTKTIICRSFLGPKEFQLPPRWFVGVVDLPKISLWRV